MADRLPNKIPPPAGTSTIDHASVARIAACRSCGTRVCVTGDAEHICRPCGELEQLRERYRWKSSKDERPQPGMRIVLRSGGHYHVGVMDGVAFLRKQWIAAQLEGDYDWMELPE